HAAPPARPPPAEHANPARHRQRPYATLGKCAAAHGHAGSTLATPSGPRRTPAATGRGSRQLVSWPPHATHGPRTDKEEVRGSSPRRPTRRYSHCSSLHVHMRV